MKSTYTIKLHPKHDPRRGAVRLAIADVCEIEDNYWICRINVPKEWRGQGIGTELLQEIIADADRGKVTLYLDILASGGLTYDQLARWYYGYGFRFLENCWIRKPK